MDLRRAGRFNLDIEADEHGELIARSWETLDGWEDAVALRERIEAEHEVQGDRIVSTNRFVPAEVWVAAFWLKVTDGVAPSAVVRCDDRRGLVFKAKPADQYVLGLPEGAASVCLWHDEIADVVHGELLLS